MTFTENPITTAGFYAADRLPQEIYLQPEFWLSGEYQQFQTDSIAFYPLGPLVVDWLSRIAASTDNPPLSLAKDMLSIASTVPNATREMQIGEANARPREMYGMRGSVGWASHLSTNHIYHLSKAARDQMAQFAIQTRPYLLDILRMEAWSDFVLRGNYVTTEELRFYGKFQAPIYHQWLQYFPTLVPHIYSNIQTDEQSKLTYLAIKPIAHEVKAYFQSRGFLLPF